jgi:hypothetical protein
MSDSGQTKQRTASILAALRGVAIPVHRPDGVRSPVPIYRVCVLTEDDQIWDPPIVLAYENDQDAVRQAEQLVDGNDVELWEESRFVARVKSKPAGTGDL